MTRDTRIALFLMGELVAALRADDPDLFKRWLSGGVQDLGEPWWARHHRATNPSPVLMRMSLNCR